MSGAPVKIFVRGDDAYREESAWPPASATMTSYYLRRGPSGSVTSLNDGGLSTEPSQADLEHKAPDMPDLARDALEHSTYDGWASSKTA